MDQLDETVPYTVYDHQTGEIRWSGRVHESIFDQMPRESGCVTVGLSTDPFTEYMLAGAPTPRPSLAFDKVEIAADGIDEAVLEGLPDPCTIMVDEVAHEVSGGRLTIVSNTPATYRIFVNQFPCIPFEAEIVAS